jgi:hypothetical protein
MRAIIIVFILAVAVVASAQDDTQDRKTAALGAQLAQAIRE